MKEFIHHLFIPRESNKQRAKILHNESLLTLIIFLLIATFFTSLLKTTHPEILGDTANVTIDKLLQITNQKRIEQGLSSLSLNSQLSQAATLKASDMFSKNYWAHDSPDGLTPWTFMGKVGYQYKYAGENLARGFSESSDVVNAWMASPTHRENMLSKDYQEVGFAIEQGNLGGENTILVVEMFGGKTSLSSEMQPSPLQKAVVSDQIPKDRLSTLVPKPIEYTPQSYIMSEQNQPIINSKSLSSSSTVVVILFVIGVLLLDMIVIERKNVVRLVGHNIDHALFLGALLLIAFFFGRGVII